MSTDEPLRQQHPSGRPVATSRWGVKTEHRIPNKEPLVPGLRRQHDTYAVGFTASICPEDEDEA